MRRYAAVGRAASQALMYRRLHRPASRGPAALLVLGCLAMFAFVGCSAAVTVASGVGTAYAYSVVTKDLPDPNELASRPLPQVTQLYDRTGTQLLYEFYEERRIAVPLDEVAPAMVKATLAAEDVNFYQHKGFDPRGLTRAFLNELRSGGHTVGGSTITQQLVKRTFLTDEKSYIRKLRELVLAVQVDSMYPKDQILEMYLNQVYYGNQAYGVEAAALSYFHKHAKDLDLAESTILAGLVQAPSDYDPVTNPEAAFRRQAEVLDVMVRYDLASPEEAAAAAEEAHTFTYQQQETDIRYPHFSFFAKQQLQQVVNPQALHNGLKVITTLDVAAQDRAQEIVRRRVDSIRWQHVNNGALVTINPQTGEVLAMVGSYDYYNKAIDGQVNVATALRQPGSSFKAFTYATAFASKKYWPASTVVDQAIKWPDIGSKTGYYEPKNYDEKYHGTVTLRSALANSYNIPALLVQKAVTTKEVIKTARTMGITTDLPEVDSLTLGAGVVRLLDMTSAYGAFANNGVRVEPTPFLKISDRQDHVLYELKDPQGQQVVSPQVAYVIADVLSDNAARRPAFGNVLDLNEGRIAAVKTGTANDYKDSWTIGFTPNLVTGVWVGNTDNSAMLQVAGSLGAGYIWKEFMDTTFKGQPVAHFAAPPGIVRAPVCRGSRSVDVFIDGTVPINCPPALQSSMLVPPVPNTRPGQPATAPARPQPVLPPR